MSSFYLAAAAAYRAEASYDAEVSLTEYVEGGMKMPKAAWSTKQRTVGTGFPTREAALAAAEVWIKENLGPVFKTLPEAKP